MANKFTNNNGFANDDEEIRNAEKVLAQARLRKRRRCYHNPASGATLIPISSKKCNLSNTEKAKYSDTTVMCERCGEIIDAQAFPEKEVHEIMFKAKSILNQIQFAAGAKFSEEDKKELEVAFESLDYVEALAEGFYVDMIEKLSNNGNGKGKGGKPSKGGVGINAGMMR